MKVVHYIRSIDKAGGGTTAYMKLLIENLSSDVQQYLVTALSEDPIFIEGMKVDFFAMSLKRFFKLKQEFKYYLEEVQPDLVHINGIWNPENALFQNVAKSLGIKVLLSPHGMLEPYILARHPIKKKIALALYQGKALENAEFLHVTAQSELNSIRMLGYCQAARIIANGVDLSEIQNKNQWNKKGTLKLLFLSRVHPKKGIEFLIDAIAELDNKDISARIVGEGNQDYVEILKRRCREKGLEQQISFVGGVYGKAKWEEYKDADLFVLPTHSENFGIVIAEALATGIPVITTKGTPWEELETQNCGWWIDIGVASLVKALKDAFGKTLRELQQMGANGNSLVLEKYDIKQVAQKMADFYSGIIKNDNSDE